MTSGGGVDGEGQPLLSGFHAKQHRQKSLSTGAIYLHRWYGSRDAAEKEERDTDPKGPPPPPAAAPQQAPGQAPEATPSTWTYRYQQDQQRLQDDDGQQPHLQPPPAPPPPTPQEDGGEAVATEKVRKARRCSGRGAGRGNKTRRSNRRSGGRRSSGGAAKSVSSTATTLASNVPTARRLVPSGIVSKGDSTSPPPPFPGALDDAARRRGVMGVLAMLMVASAMMASIDSTANLEQGRAKAKRNGEIHVAFVGDATDYYRHHPQLFETDNAVKSDVSCLQTDASLLSLVNADADAASGRQTVEDAAEASLEEEEEGEERKRKERQLPSPQADSDKDGHDNWTDGTTTEGSPSSVPVMSSSSSPGPLAPSRRTVQDLFSTFSSAGSPQDTVDYLVLTDALSHVMDPTLHQATVTALQTIYAPLLWGSPSLDEQSTTVILLMATEAGASLDVQAIQEGYEAYAVALRQANVRHVRIAPVALAFQHVHQMYRKEVWPKLFRVAPNTTKLSRQGSWLQACILHWTIFGYEPPLAAAAAFQKAAPTKTSFLSFLSRRGRLRRRRRRGRQEEEENGKEEENPDNDDEEETMTTKEAALLRNVARVVYCSYHEGGHGPLVKSTKSCASLS